MSDHCSSQAFRKGRPTNAFILDADANPKRTVGGTLNRVRSEGEIISLNTHQQKGPVAETRIRPVFSQTLMKASHRIPVYVQAKSEKNFSFRVTHYLRLRQAFFHKFKCLLPLGQAQRLNRS